MSEKPPQVKPKEALKLPSLLPFFDKTKEFLNKKMGMGKMVEQIKDVVSEVTGTLKSGFQLFEKMFKPAFVVTVASLLLATSFWPLGFMASPYFIVPTAAGSALYAGGAFDKPAAAQAPAKK